MEKAIPRLAALLLCLMIPLLGCTPMEVPALTEAITTAVIEAATAAPTTAPPTTAATEPPTTAAPEPINIRITAVGDILLHNTVTNSCQTAGGGFDFSPLFTHVAPALKGSDIAFVNQEVMLTGEVYNYPRFAAPYEVADALKDAGFNVVNLATNHTMDRGVEGLEKCIKAVDARDFDAVLGVFATEEASQAPILLEKQGVTFGFLSYTYGLNGIPGPKGKPWMISVLSETDGAANNARITAEVEALRPLCDYLIVSMHWGVEYTHTPTKTQKSQAALLAELGVDLVIGHHPHVVQPLEWIEAEDGHQMLCMYSLGNFVSNQQRYETMLGGFLEVNLTFDPVSLKLEATDAGVIPLVTHYSNRKYTTYFLADYTDDLARVHGIERASTAFSVGYLDTLAKKVLGEMLVFGDR